MYELGAVSYFSASRPRARRRSWLPFPSPQGRGNTRLACAYQSTVTVALLACSVACAGQAPATGPGNWRTELAACYVRGVCVDRVRAEQVLTDLDRLAASGTPNGRPAKSVELSLARVDGWLALGDMERASVALDAVARWPVGDPRRAALLHRTSPGWVEEHRCAIAGAQRHWRSAAVSYARWRAPFYRGTVVPACLLPLAWFALWRYSGKHRETRNTRAAHICVVLCAIPLLWAMMTDVAMLTVGLVSMHNPFGALLRPSVAEAGRHLATAGGNVVMLLAGYWILRLLSLPVMPDWARRCHTRSRYVAARRLLVGLAAVVIGVVIVDWPWLRPGLPAEVFAGTWSWHRVVSIAEACLVGPVVQQFLWRHAVLRVAQRLGGLAFAVVFSALLSSGMNLNMTHAYTFLIAGLVFAAQYVRFGSLSVPIATEAVLNLLAQARA